MSHDVDTIVVGAGVVGLAIARALAVAGIDVLILEEKLLFGSETSARNSEVIHAGIYYPKNSNKALLCTRGKLLLYDYCKTHAIEHKQLGKIIVATSNRQVSELDAITARARANGVEDLQRLGSKDITALEPAIVAKAGLLSPSTGIIDSHGFMLSLLGSAESHGAMIAYNSKADHIKKISDGFSVTVVGEDSITIDCKRVVNAAGHGACALANSIPCLPSETIPVARFSKGNYFRLQAKTPVTRLIYPVPEPGGLGVHITVDLAGQSRFGPDVQMQDLLDYKVDAGRATHFYDAIRRYWPALEDNTLVPDYAGVRPKIAFDDVLATDFIIQDKQQHGIDGLVNLFGIESPGLTSSLAIAELVSGMIAKNI